MANGRPWHTAAVKSVCSEYDYYDSLIQHFRTQKRLFPYHLAEYLCRFMRITSFKYYLNIIADAMRNDLPYDAIPNFTAADALRTVGVGRNQYISILNHAKSKKLLWRVNKGIVKDFLPQQPVPPEPECWWTVNVVNLGEAEWRSLSAEEAKTCKKSAIDGGIPYRLLDPKSVLNLYCKGLIWFGVPIQENDLLSVPPLEGFVSNRTTSQESDTDPLEALLYQIFVAASDRVTVLQLADILSKDLEHLKTAVSIACRLHFCKKLTFETQKKSDIGYNCSKVGESSTVVPITAKELIGMNKNQNPPCILHGLGKELDSGDSPCVGNSELVRSERHQINSEIVSNVDSLSQASTVYANDKGNQTENDQSLDLDNKAVALVVDSELTGMLMMGALSSVVKKHSVTLFEGGRVYGDAVIRELMSGLEESAAVVSEFEGEMAYLAMVVSSLSQILETVVGNVNGKSIELLRKESLECLDKKAIRKMILHSYSMLIPMARLSGSPLPLNSVRSEIRDFGPSIAASTPWAIVVLWIVCGYSKASMMVIPAGKRLNHLPDWLTHKCNLLLCWPWDPDACRIHPSEPLVLPLSTALMTLNSLLSTTAVLIHPADFLDSSKKINIRKSNTSRIDVVEVPLPLDDATESGFIHGNQGGMTKTLCGFRKSGASEVVNISSSCFSTLKKLGFESCIGSLSFLHQPDDVWIPLIVTFGIPVMPTALCKAVCQALESRGILSSSFHSHKKDRPHIDPFTNEIQKFIENWSYSHHGPTADAGKLLPRVALKIDMISNQVEPLYV